MKKILHINTIKYSYLLGAILIYILTFQGCGKHVKDRYYPILQFKKASLINLYDLKEKCMNAGIRGCQSNYISMPLSLPEEKLKNYYGLLFYIKFDRNKYIKLKKDDPSYIDWGLPFVLTPCDMNVSITDEPLTLQGTPLAYDKIFFDEQKTELPRTKYIVYFDIESLMKAGYITTKREDQKALCLYLKVQGGGMEW